MGISRIPRTSKVKKMKRKLEQLNNIGMFAFALSMTSIALWPIITIVITTTLSH